MLMELLCLQKLCACVSKCGKVVWQRTILQPAVDEAYLRIQCLKRHQSHMLIEMFSHDRA